MDLVKNSCFRETLKKRQQRKKENKNSRVSSGRENLESKIRHSYIREVKQEPNALMGRKFH